MEKEENEYTAEEWELESLKGSSFLVKSRCAVSLLTAKLQIANEELSLKLGRNVLLSVSSRIKSAESIKEKCRKKGYSLHDVQAVGKINDIIGVRAVCSFEDDIYRMTEALCAHRDLRVIKKKDYIRYPKSSGYRSFHLIVEVPIYFQKEICWIRAEIQLRTTAMDFWAGVDHELRYKKGKKEAILIGKELKEYSLVVAELDEKMVELRRQIEAI